MKKITLIFAIAASSLFLLNVIEASAKRIETSDKITFKLRNPFKQFDGFRKNRLKAYNPAVQNYIRAGRWNHLRDLYVHPDCMKKNNNNSYKYQDRIHCSEKKIARKFNYVNRLLRKNSNDNSLLHDSLHSLLSPNYDVDTNRFIYHAINKNYGISKIFYNDHDVKDGGCLLPDDKRKIRSGCVLADVHLDDKFLSTLNENATCTWRISGRTFLPRKCKKKFGDNLNIKLFIETPNQIEVTISEPQKEEITYVLNEQDSIVKEVLIVGMGDSFASGEGAPDIPTDPKRNTAGEDTAAYWIERRCHRSALSSQMRAAIQFAADNPKKLTTFLGFACSGATITDGILGNYRYAGEEIDLLRKAEQQLSWYHSKTVKKNAKKLINFLTRSQIEQAKTALCEKKLLRSGKNAKGKDLIIEQCIGDKPKFVRDKIDYLLLSVGGNDIGFGGVIASALAPSNFPKINNRLKKTSNDFFYNIFKDNFPKNLDKCKNRNRETLVDQLADKAQYFHKTNRILVSPNFASEQIKNNLPPLYALLDCELRKKLPPIKNIIISVYPNPLFKTKPTNGEEIHSLCSGKNGMQNFVNGIEITPNEASSVNAMIALLQKKIVTTASINKNWFPANNYNFKFLNKGWCKSNNYNKINNQKNNAYLDMGALILSPNRAIEIEATEIKNKKIWQTFLQHFAPKPFNAYMRRTAIFHPNNFGHAVIADNYNSKMDELK